MKPKRIFVAATRQNDGKTSVSLGLFKAFQNRFKRLAYIKPVGQETQLFEDQKIDKDAVLFKKVYGLKCDARYMSPVTVPKGFTESYIYEPDPKKLASDIKSSFNALAKDHDFILIEGTGHAGVGSVFDMSNADVAKLIGSKVILVSPGGVGRAIDEILLNKAYFDRLGVELLGVIVNKVHPDKYEKVSRIVRDGLERKGVPVLGIIPHVKLLTRPLVSELMMDLDAQLISGEGSLKNVVEKFVIGDRLPHNALDSFASNTLLIVPATREGLIMTALCGNLIEGDLSYSVSAMIFTDGTRPHERIFDILKRTHIPILGVPEDSFTVATRINNMILKIRSEETEKIKTIQSLVDTYVDIDRICEGL